MFYDVEKAIKACEEEPSSIFKLIKEEKIEAVDKLLSRKKVSVNLCDEAGNDVITRLLKAGCYDLVLKHMKNKDWNVNHQNYDGNNLNYIKETIAKEKNKPANNPFFMFMDESGNGKSPKITKESRENNAKTLIKALNSIPTKKNK